MLAYPPRVKLTPVISFSGRLHNGSLHIVVTECSASVPTTGSLSGSNLYAMTRLASASSRICQNDVLPDRNTAAPPRSTHDSTLSRIDALQYSS